MHIQHGIVFFKEVIANHGEHTGETGESCAAALKQSSCVFCMVGQGSLVALGKLDDGILLSIIEFFWSSVTILKKEKTLYDWIKERL